MCGSSIGIAPLEALAFALIASAQATHFVVLLQKVQNIIHVWRLTRSPYRQIAHGHHGNIEAHATQQASTVQKLPKAEA